MRRAIFGLALLAAACVQGNLFHSSPSESPEERFNDRWVGRSEDDVIVQYGRPEVLELSTGNHVDSYHREIAVSSSRGGGVANQYGASSASRSDSSTVDCDRRFEIDKQTLRVVRAVITGSSCDFNR